MSGRVKEHPNALLGLHSRERRPCLDRVLGGLDEILDEDIQVLRRILHSGLTRPRRRRPLRLVLKVERRLSASRRRPDLGPAGGPRLASAWSLFCRDRPTEQARIEAGECARIRASDSHRSDLKAQTIHRASVQPAIPDFSAVHLRRPPLAHGVRAMKATVQPTSDCARGEHRRVDPAQAATGVEFVVGAGRPQQRQPGRREHRGAHEDGDADTDRPPGRRDGCA